ncbi:hypothetical protein [Pseudomonas aeruginosa]|nr:hypothetical protein [Pseudomonas aeruginosa]QFZ60773.1 hypothetical protein FVF66_06425 [Pseudomonas aeruginosa PA99]EKU5590462.1 hypothetical protein [Pseudomonas aeruginosa]KAF0591422.1 hypothetical protein PAPB9_06247 [Pseudomonas aeruginosa]MBG4892570.1 hypothetical protein [Pseudomonas aeruginosa]MBG4908705.1 hypothetical protein [Pseudomonas aeruginosa]
MKPEAVAGAAALQRATPLIQQNLVRLNVTDVYPQSTGTAHAGGFCQCDNGMDYAFKAARPDSMFVPATEWLCSHLSIACRIQTPPMDALYTSDGQVWFGSRIEGGKLDEDQCLLELQAGDMAARIVNLRERLSMIYALDLFINNTDRHAKNYLFRTSLDRTVMMAFDFSFAWLAHGPALRGYPADGSNTTQAHLFLARMYGFDQASAHGVLDLIQALPDDWIDVPVNSMPNEWKQGVDLAAATTWWKSDERPARCAEIKEAIM